MKRKLILLIIGIIGLLILLFTPQMGTHWISPLTHKLSELDSHIFINLRIPRVLFAFACGSALSLSGMAFQAMFRNPLATPFTLGVSSGAALGGALYIRLGLGFFVLGVPGITLFAFSGALVTLVAVYTLTRVRGGFSTSTLLLAGIAINFFCSSLILFVKYLSGFGDSFSIMRWMMGALDITGYTKLLQILPFIIAGTVILGLLVQDLNLLLTGEDLAQSRGVPVARTKKLVFLAASLLVGSVVAFCGPIGFVGMMAPHIVRLLLGHDHRWLMPGTLLFGGVFMVLCDTLARTLISPGEIPVGVITALLGGPFFLWLLLNRKGHVEF
ncbi:FecCD family ABC transporter permease [Verrucomicrobiota bacterium]